jgi:hypothetical protein
MASMAQENRRNTNPVFCLNGYGAIGIVVYFVAGREVRRRGLRNARLTSLHIGALLVAGLATYGIFWLLG